MGNATPWGRTRGHAAAFLLVAAALPSAASAESLRPGGPLACNEFCRSWMGIPAIVEPDVPSAAPAPLPGTGIAAPVHRRLPAGERTATPPPAPPTRVLATGGSSMTPKRRRPAATVARGSVPLPLPRPETLRAVAEPLPVMTPPLPVAAPPPLRPPPAAPDGTPSKIVAALPGPAAPAAAEPSAPLPVTVGQVDAAQGRADVHVIVVNVLGRDVRDVDVRCDARDARGLPIGRASTRIAAITRADVAFGRVLFGPDVPTVDSRFTCVAGLAGP